MNKDNHITKTDTEYSDNENANKKQMYIDQDGKKIINPDLAIAITELEMHLVERGIMLINKDDNFRIALKELKRDIDFGSYRFYENDNHGGIDIVEILGDQIYSYVCLDDKTYTLLKKVQQYISIV